MDQILSNNLYQAGFSHLEPLCGVVHMALTTLHRRRFSPLKKRTAWSFDGKTNARPGPSPVCLVYCRVVYVMLYSNSHVFNDPLCFLIVPVSTYIVQ